MTATDPAAGYDPLASVDPNAVARPAPKIRLASPVTGEEEVEAIRRVLESGILTNGPETRRFESMMAERHDTEHGIAFANGTVALTAMFLAAGIGPGDEVIVPSLTFFSTATSVMHAGATPVFAEIDPTTMNLDPEDAARKITPATKAIMPVHYAGQPAAMDRFVDLGAEAGIRIFEDAAQAHGARYQGRGAGSWGAAAMFSFTPTKNITTGEGSIVTTNDGDLAQSMRLLRNHGMSRQYYHEILGYNWRLSDLQSAMGCCQMDRLDGILATKRANAARLAARLSTNPLVQVPTEAPGAEHPWMFFTLQVPAERREAIGQALDAAGIEWRIYFPPAHLQPVFADRPRPDLPVTEAVADRILTVPIHTRVAPEQLDEIADVILGEL